MYHISRWAIVCGLLAMAFLGQSFAAEQLDKGTLETLIKGNTVEGKKIKWKTTYKMYFDPSGKFWRIDSLDNKERGKWSVENDGTLRMTGRKERDRTVKQRSDGGYDVYNVRGQVIWTMDKVTPGNPYNLEPK
jgi:hypothetical protein